MSSASAPQPGQHGRPALWVRALAALPLRLLHGLGGFLAWFAVHVRPYRRHVVRPSLAMAFPDRSPDSLQAIEADFYRHHADVMLEVVKAFSITAEELRERVRVVNPEILRTALAGGKPVLVVAAHQCNWEWLLLALCVHFDTPVDAAYKPLVDSWAEREMRIMRTRFGARLVPAQQLLADLLQRRQLVRIVALVADQEPVDSEQKHWVRFLNRDSAFFVGPEEIARKFRYPSLFVAMRCTARGRYEIEFTSLASPGEPTVPGQLTARYAQMVERQIHASPPDWPWSHKRWKVKPAVYRDHAGPGTGAVSD